MQSSGRLEVSPNSVYDFTSDDLQDLGEIGRGAFGTVNKMIHRKSNTVMAVKVIFQFKPIIKFYHLCQKLKVSYMLICFILEN